MAKKAGLPHHTQNDLSVPTRGMVVAILNARLADSIDLTLHAKQAHWNVKGPQFMQLHELFDQVADAAREAADLIAERAVQLGGVADGTIQGVAKHTTLKAYPTTLSAGADHVKALSASIATVGKGVRAAIDDCEAAGDVDSADLFTEVSRSLDKLLWFVEAHSQAPR